MASLAVPMRTDGAVDRMQIHNIHLEAKVVHQDGNDSLYFHGFGESEKGAKGYLAAIMEACSPLSWNDLFGKTSSFVTDGDNMNTGAKNGLWALYDDYRKKSNSNLPLIKIWCAAHRINLAWKSVTKEVGAVLTEKERRGTYNRYVSDRRSFDAIRNEVIQSLINFLDYRLDNDSLASTAAFSPLKQLSSSTTNEQLRACHKVICPDLPLVDFASEYKEAA
eukprot:gene13325-4171_t